MAELVILGSSGWIPRDGRMTTCLALRTDEDLVLLDAGSGLGRFCAEPYSRLLPAPDRTINVLLTHLHYDHVIGLSFLPALWKNPTVVHVPTGIVEDDGPQALDKLLAPPFFPLRFDDLLPGISRRPIGPGKWQIAGLSVMARRQEHPGGSLGYRVGDWLALLTDCTCKPSETEFVRGVGILIHEAWTSKQDDPHGLKARTSGHSTAEQAAHLAKKAGVGELLLTHLPPADDSYHVQMLEEAREIFPHASLCQDGLTRSLG